MSQIYRPIVFSDKGMVVSGHHRASEAGAAVLRAGGNAIDAAVAASATLCVAVPHMNGVGGDCFALYYDARSRAVSALNGSGAAPAALTQATLVALGHRSVPQRGPLPISVCGLVQAWEFSLEAFGTRRYSLSELIKGARDLAVSGSEVDIYLGRYLDSDAYAARAAACPELAAVFGARGTRQLGERIPQKALAETLDVIAGEGARALYGGTVGQRLTDDLAVLGGMLTLKDLAAHETTLSGAPHVRFHGHHLYFAPPNSQGIALGVLAGLWERLREKGMPDDGLDPGQYMRIKRLAFACRDRFALDPQWGGLIPANLFNTEQLSALLDEAGTTDTEARRGGGDTSTLVVVDQWGNAVSWVQSLFEDFGCGMMSPSTGIVPHNRLYLERLDDSPHGLRPGKRPFHTLCPALLVGERGCEMAIATPGDHGQPQSIFQVLVNVYGRRMNIQAAIEAPRIRHDSGTDVLYESRVAREWVEQIAALGLNGVDAGAWSTLLGGVNAIQQSASGTWMSGADPRRSCYAVCA